MVLRVHRGYRGRRTKGEEGGEGVDDMQRAEDRGSWWK